MQLSTHPLLRAAPGARRRGRGRFVPFAAAKKEGGKGSKANPRLARILRQYADQAEEQQAELAEYQAARGERGGEPGGGSDEERGSSRARRRTAQRDAPSDLVDPMIAAFDPDEDKKVFR